MYVGGYGCVRTYYGSFTGYETGESARASHPYDFSRYLSVQFSKDGIIGGIIYRATPALRLLVEEVIRLFRLNNFGLEENVWLGWLQALSGNVYRNYSKDGLLFLFWQHLRESVSEEELHKIRDFYM